MAQDGEVDGRDFIERKGWAFAPSLALGLDGDTRAYFYLLHTEHDNTPDGGIPTIGLDGFYNAAFDTGGANAGVDPERVDRENWYGLDSDFEDIKGTMFTARFEHDFNDNVTLRNTSRYGKLRQFYVLTGVNALTVTDPNPDLWTVARTRQAKFQENTLLTNQTNLTASLSAGGVDHAITAGFEFIDEQQFNPTYVGLGTPIPAANVTTPAAMTHCRRTRRREMACTPAARRRPSVPIVFDTLSFADRWQVTGGARVDSFDTDFNARGVVDGDFPPALPVGTLVPVALQAQDTVLSYKLGVLYKPAANGSIYLSHATSLQPPGGANFTLSATRQQRQPLGPGSHRRRQNLELGTKWEFRDGAFAVTAALFDSSNKNELDRGSRRPHGVRPGGRTFGPGCRAGRGRQAHRELAAVAPASPGWTPRSSVVTPRRPAPSSTGRRN